MKTGAEYLHSKQKRAVDIALGSLLSPLGLGACVVAELSFGEPGRLFFYQERTGQNAEPFMMKKIRTLNDKGIVLGGLAQWFRDKGVDELSQLAAIRSGQMSFFGSRPLIPEEYDNLRTQATKTLRGRELLAEHDDVVMPAKRGLFSRYGLLCHTGGYGNPVEQRLSMDIEDHANASFSYDVQTLYMGLKMAVNNELLRRGNPTS